MSLAKLRTRLRHGAPIFSPFLMVGDPDPSLCVELAQRAQEAGAGMLELGLHYSDPAADGPAIQGAGRRARAAEVGVARAFEIIAEMAETTGLPLNLMSYASLVEARGPGRFVADARAAGVSSLLVPDLPLEESGALRDLVLENGVGWVEMVAPTTSATRRVEMIRREPEFLYRVGRQGITGARGTIAAGLLAELGKLREDPAPPIAVGFGLSRPDQLRAVIQAGARIAIVGSALVSIIEEFQDDRDRLGQRFSQACRAYAAATLASEESPC